MFRKFLRSFVYSLLCVGGAAAALATEVVLEPPRALPLKPAAAVGDPLADLDLHQEVDRIYGRYADRLRASAQPVKIEVSKPKSYGLEQFDELRWFELFTPVHRWQLETTEYTDGPRLPSQSRMSLGVEWQEVSLEHEGGWSPEELESSLPLLTVREVLVELAAWEPARHAGVTALTSFEVRVSYAKRSVAYRALALWKPLDGETVLVGLVDIVIPNLVDAQLLNRPVVPRSQLAAGIGGGARAVPGKLEGNACPTGTSTPFALGLTSPRFLTGHETGFHIGSLKPNYRCERRNCRSSCFVRSEVSCDDHGRVAGVTKSHKTFRSYRADQLSAFGTRKAECGVAFGCAVKECRFGVCGSLSFSFSGRGLGLSVNVAGAVLDDMSLKDGIECPPGEIPDSCFASVDQTKTLAVDTGEIADALPGVDRVLDRVERSDVVHEGQAVSYILEEWALLSHSPAADKSAEPRVEVLRASQRDFGQSKRRELVNALQVGALGKSGAQEGVMLTVALPPHESNSRMIDMPELKVAAGPVARQSARPTGPTRRVLVRADFGEDHRLQDLDFLFDSEGGVEDELALHIERSLRLDSPGDEHHRVVVFALLEVADDLKLVSDLPFLPKCCCNGVPC